QSARTRRFYLTGWPRRLTRASWGLTDDLVLGEELGDLHRGGFRPVGAVDRVLAHRTGMELADGAVGRLGPIGCPPDVAMPADGVPAFAHLPHHRPQNHEPDELPVERPPRVNGINPLGLPARHPDALLRDDAQPRLLDQGVDRAGQIARGGIGFDDREGA